MALKLSFPWKLQEISDAIKQLNVESTLVVSRERPRPKNKEFCREIVQFFLDGVNEASDVISLTTMKLEGNNNG